MSIFSPSPSTQSSTSGLPPELMPYLMGFAQSGAQAAQMPNYQGQRVAGLSSLQRNALGGINQMMNYTPELDQAGGTLMDLAGAGMNPYTQQVINPMIADATRAFQNATAGQRARAAGSGVFGSSSADRAQSQLNEDFGRGLNASIGNLYSQAFEQNQNRRMSAASQLPGIYQSRLGGLQAGLMAGQVPRGYEQELLNSQMQDYFYPRNQMEWYGQNVLGPMTGASRTTTTTSQQGSDPLSQMLGVGMSLFSPWGMFGGR